MRLFGRIGIFLVIFGVFTSTPIFGSWFSEQDLATPVWAAADLFDRCATNLRGPDLTIGSREWRVWLLKQLSQNAGHFDEFFKGPKAAHTFQALIGAETAPSGAVLLNLNFVDGFSRLRFQISNSMSDTAATLNTTDARLMFRKPDREGMVRLELSNYSSRVDSRQTQILSAIASFDIRTGGLWELQLHIQEPTNWWGRAVIKTLRFDYFEE